MTVHANVDETRKTQPKLTESMSESAFIRALAAGRKDFDRVEFTTEVNWDGLSELKGDFFFHDTVFHHTLNIGDLRLWGGLHFERATFHAHMHVFRSRVVNLVMEGAHCTGPLSFGNDSWFSGLNLANVQCDRQFWLEADVTEHLMLDGLNSPRTFINWDRVPASGDDTLASLGEILLLPKNR